MAGASMTGKRALRAWLLGTTALLPAIGAAQAQSVAPNARPTGGQVVAGSASISQSPNTTTIHQTTDRAAINWQSFNVGSQQSVNFQQPSASSWTLNRVVTSDPSVIAGRITANGGVAIVNQSGVVFAQGAQVNVGSLIASAANITNQNFMNGRMVFDGAPNPGARVENHGEVTVADRGLAALVGPRVANTGTIRARLGRVALQGAETYSLDLAGDGLLSIDVTQAVRSAPDGSAALVTNSGVIDASGGSVLISASAASGLVEDLVRNTGRISAATDGGRTGMVALRAEGGNVRVEGNVAATGGAGQRGGSVSATASGTVTVAQGARVDASGGAGGGGVAIGSTRTRAARVQGTVTARGTGQGARGGSVAVQATESASVAGSGKVDVSGKAGGGDIRLGTAGFGRNQPVAANTTLEEGARLVADATASGNGGTIAVNSSALTTVLGTLSARGGPQGGNGGFVEVSALAGIRAPNLLAAVDVGAPAGRAGTLSLDPDVITIAAAGSAAPGDVAAGDDPGTTLTLSAASVSAFDGDLVLEAVQTINVNAAINKASGDLTLRTTGTTGTPGIFVNAVITLGAGGETPSGGALTLASATGITVGGAITVFNGSATLTAATTLAINEAVTAAASSTFTGTDGISLQKAVNVGDANALTLRSDGAITADAANGIITANTLIVQGATGANAGAVTLEAANAISNLSVASSAAVSVVAANALTVTGLTAGGAVQLRTGIGLLTIAGDIGSGGSLIDLEGAGGISIGAHVNAGASQVVLRTGAGFDNPGGTATISETASGRITAGSLAASAGGDITLDNSLNAFASLAAGRNRGGTGSPTRAVTSNGGNATIVATDLSIDAPVVLADSAAFRADTTGTLTVAATGGIDAGSVDLNRSSGTGTATQILGAVRARSGNLEIANLTGDLTTGGTGTLRADLGQISVSTFGALTIGAAVTADAGRIFLESSGLTTIGAKVTGSSSGIEIRAGDLDIGDRVAAPDGEINIRTVSPGLVIGIGGDQGGGDPAGIYLNATELGLLGGSGASGGTVAATRLRFTPVGADLTVLGDVALRGRVGVLEIEGVANVLHSGGNIDVGRVVVKASGNVDLARAGASNRIDELAAASSGGGTIAVSSTDPLATTLTIVSDSSSGVSGIGGTVTPSAVTLTARALALQAPVAATALSLTATTGGITQSASGVVNAGSLTATAQTGVALATANNATTGNLIGSVTASTATGGVALFSRGALTVATGGVTVASSGGVELTGT
ncbi:filamentous hemagglutinin N-terminal domain-containing protein, partial [Siccirubricoccus sp. KC 17139]